MGANYSFKLNSIQTYAPQFFGYSNSVLAIVGDEPTGENFPGRISGNYLGTHEQYLGWVQSTVTSKKYFSVFFVKSLLQVAK